MKHNRSWLSLIGYCLMTAVGAALAFALIMAGGSVALASRQEAQENQKETVPAAPQVANDTPAPQAVDLTTFTGLVTDSYCGARHLRHSNLSPAECAATCIRGGASFVLVDGDHTYHLNGSEESLGKLLGTRASVTGTRDGDTIRVSSAGPMF